MQPGVRRHSFTSSDLTRLLADLCLQDASGLFEPQGADEAEAAQSFGERLGLWLNWTDAIALSAALSGAPAAAPAAAGLVAAKVDLERELARTRAALAQAVAQEGAKLAKESPEAATDFTPLRRHYANQQRAMETALAPLRTQLRAQLAQTGAAGARLAALDAVLDNALAARERAVLAQVPTLLEERHARLRKAHRAALAAAEAAAEAGEGMEDGLEGGLEDGPQDGPAGSAATVQAAGIGLAPWLPGLHKDLHGVLLAELDLRLQPLLGLLEALKHEQPQEKTQEKKHTR